MFDIWPIFCSIKELDFKTKGKLIVLCGLWLGTKKPLLETFFKQFIDEANILYNSGFEWTHSTVDSVEDWGHLGPIQLFYMKTLVVS